jgi:cytochrome c-type biogenesis protein CcmH
MILFWFLAGLIACAAALLILIRAGRAERTAGGPDPRLEVYRRQLSEIDDLAERGLLGPEEHRAAKAEAGRRLLSEAEDAGARPARPKGGRRLALAGAALAPALALGVYLLLGSPGLRDQPYAERLKAWRQIANTDPGKLDVDETAAVLESIAAERPDDPQPLIFLGRLRAAQGQAGAAVRALDRAAQLRPRDPDIWSILGQTEVALADGEVTSDAREAFEKARALDPKAPAPRYFLARGDIAAGRVQQGLQGWKELAADLPASDPRRTELMGEIEQVSRTGALPAAEPQAQRPPAEGAQQAQFIQSMVDRLAARLKAQPDDPEGWARLIRAYGVLGQTGRRDEAIATARRLFKDRPADLKTALSTAP